MKKRALLQIMALLVTFIGIAGLTLLSPMERTLGSNVRIVYLHGAWVWTALITLVASGLSGLTGLLLRRFSLHLWSRALGRVGTLFWITYLPISLWAMQSNWNGLFLAEPRWRLAVIFAISGLLMQAGISLLEKPIWASTFNLVFVLALYLSLAHTEEVMHPSSPIFASESKEIQVFFVSLLGLTLLAAWQLAQWWYRSDRMRYHSSPIKHPSSSTH